MQFDSYIPHRRTLAAYAAAIFNTSRGLCQRTFFHFRRFNSSLKDRQYAPFCPASGRLYLLIQACSVFAFIPKALAANAMALSYLITSMTADTLSPAL